MRPITRNKRRQPPSEHDALQERAIKRRRAWTIVAWTVGLVALIISGSLLALSIEIATYVDPWEQTVKDAGYVAKSARVDGLTLNYVEGPANGPPLVLLHAQFLDWLSYRRVLPALAKSFHVYDIDYPGHGHTVTPPNYPMTANQIGSDLGAFIERDIGKQVFVTGNSSGGLLATWLAANRPDLVRAALLEDPPLFSSEFPEIQHTIANRAFVTSYKATRAHDPDFLLFWIHGNAPFFTKFVGPGAPFALTAAVKIYRFWHPGEPPDIGLIHNDIVRMLVRGLDEYDPRFGAAFFDGTWNAGFDHAAALMKIRCPTMVVQANYSMLPDGTLNGAMTNAEARRAVSLLKNGSYVKVDAEHVINLDKPTEFVRLVDSFFLGEAQHTSSSPSH